MQLLVSQTKLTQDKVREILEVTDHTWAVASFYNQRFQHVDRDTLEIMISKLEADIESSLDEPGDYSGNHLFAPMRLLVQANTHDQLAHLREYSGSRFEQLLVGHILRIGPRSGASSDSLVLRESIGLLLRINGDGYCQAVNSLLIAESHFGRHDGMTFAQMKSNSETLQILTNICESEEKMDGHYVEQCHAASVLAANNVWAPILSLISKAGFELLKEVSHLPLYGIRPDTELLLEVTNRAETAPESLSPGDIISLGFGTERHARVVSNLSSHFVFDTEHAQACVFALYLLSDSDDKNLGFLKKQLEVQRHRHLAMLALLRNGTQPALELLEDHATEGNLAAILINELEDRASVIEKVKHSISSSMEDIPNFILSGTIQNLVSQVNNREALAEVLSDPKTEELIRDLAFQDDDGGLTASQKYDWILCLSKLDKNAAYIAAKAALMNREIRNRDSYPSLMMSIDDELAVPFLLEVIKFEADKEVKVAMGRALARSAISEHLFRELESTDSRSRFTACFISKWQRPSNELEQRVRSRVTDIDESVSREAAIAINALMVQREVDKLGDLFLQTVEDSIRWLLLESLLNLSDVGDNFNPWPIYGPDIVKELSVFQIDHCNRELKRKRNKR
ncbi:hypothetical protein [Gimesia chilikensis]|nr:hypothetical protein [Gimesia chilikensis]